MAERAANQAVRAQAKGLATQIVKYPKKDVTSEIKALSTAMEGIQHISTLRFCDSVVLEATAWMKKQDTP